MTARSDQTPAGAGRDAARATPAGSTRKASEMATWNDIPAPGRAGSDEERAAQRDTWKALAALAARGRRGTPGRHRTARGTLPPPRAGMIRRPPPPQDGDDDA